MTVITGGPLLNSAGEPTNGRLFLEQTARFETATGFVTQARYVARVVNGQILKADSDQPLDIPPTPDTQALRIYEELGGMKLLTRTVAIPNEATVTYAQLQDVVPPAQSGSFVVPDWVAEMLAAKDDAVSSASLAASSEAAAVNAAADAESARAAAVAAQTAAEAVPAQVDTAMASVAADPTSEFAIQQNATIAARSVLGPRWVFDGDSITISSLTFSGPSSIQDRGHSWTTILAGLSQGRIDYVFNAALAGQASASMLTRFDTYVTPHKPDVVFATIGTNDVGTGIGLAAFQANIIAYHAKVKSLGARLILGTIWPTDDTTVANRQVTGRAWNDWTHEWASANGVIVVPWGALANPVTGGWPAGWSSDGLHPGASTDSFRLIAEFAWRFLEPMVGPKALRSPSSNGGDLLANGLFTTLTTAVAPPSVTAATSTASGTLAAGTYNYKVTARNEWGESAPSVAIPATLAGTGTITLTVPNATPAGNKGFRLYRKGPSDTDFLYIGKVASGTYSIIDDGSAVSGTAILGVDTSQYPTGITLGSTSPHSLGAGVRTDARFRGNVLRITPLENGVSSTGDYINVTGLVAGDLIDVSMLLAANTLVPKPIIRLRQADGTSQVANLLLLNDTIDGDLVMLHLRFAVPTNATQFRLGLETSGTSGYVDCGEVRVARVPAV